MKARTALLILLFVSNGKAQLLTGDEEATTAAISTAASASSFYYNPSSLVFLSPGKRISASGSSFARTEFKSETGFDHSKDAGFEFRPGYVSGSRTSGDQAFGFFLVNTASFALPLDYAGSDVSGTAQLSGSSRVEGQDVGVSFASKITPASALGANLLIREAKRNAFFLGSGSTAGPTYFTAYSSSVERTRWVFAKLGATQQSENFKLGASLEIPVTSLQAERTVQLRSQSGNTILSDLNSNDVVYREQPWGFSLGAEWALTPETFLTLDSQYEAGLSYTDESQNSVLSPEVKTLSLGLRSNRNDKMDFLMGTFFSSSSSLEAQFLSFGVRRKEDSSNWTVSPFYYRSRPKESGQIQLTVIGINFSTSLSY